MICSENFLKEGKNHARRVTPSKGVLDDVRWITNS